jgi:hypothetical protein
MSIKAQFMLCDHAQVAEGKLFISGGGVTRIRGAVPRSFSVAALVQIPWDRANEPISVRFDLVDQDGRQVVLDDRAVTWTAQVEVGRPVGVAPGTPLDWPVVVPAAVPLPPGRYTWVLTIDGRTGQDWRQSFTVQA